jgi:amino acid permease
MVVTLCLEMEQKDRLSLYREFYKYELDARAELNMAINTPILLLTIIISLHVYIFTRETNETIRELLTYIACINVIPIIVIIFFLGRSFMNLGRAHDYIHVNGMDKFEKYWLELDKHKRTGEFSVHLEKEFANAAGDNFIINVQRREDIAYAKIALFWSIVISFIFSIIFITSLIINKNSMEKTNGSSTPKESANKQDVVINPPQNVKVKSDTGDMPMPTTITNEKQTK